MNDPYASHLPVLRHLIARLPIRRVLEFGAGQYSTRLFLEMDVQLVTVEASEEWRHWLQGQSFRNVVMLPEKARWDDLDEFDLIFIDDGQADAERIATICAVAALRPAAVVVIHDFEHLPYQQAAAELDHRFIDTHLKPWTAVCWNGDRPELEAILDEIHPE